MTAEIRVVRGGTSSFCDQNQWLSTHRMFSLFVYLSFPLVSTSWWMGSSSYWRPTSSKQLRNNDISLCSQNTENSFLASSSRKIPGKNTSLLGFELILYPVLEAGKKSLYWWPCDTLGCRSDWLKEREDDPTRREGMRKYTRKQNVRCHRQL